MAETKACCSACVTFRATIDMFKRHVHSYRILYAEDLGEDATQQLLSEDLSAANVTALLEEASPSSDIYSTMKEFARNMKLYEDHVAHAQEEKQAYLDMMAAVKIDKRRTSRATPSRQSADSSHADSDRHDLPCLAIDAMEQTSLPWVLPNVPNSAYFYMKSRFTSW